MAVSRTARSARTLALLGSTLALSCTTVQTPPPLVPVARQVEQEPLPPDPREEPLPVGTPPGDWILPQEQGVSAPRAGLLVSEARASRDALFRIRYPELRTIFAGDRRVWTVHRELYETQLRSMQTALERAQPSWFERNSLAIGLSVGILVGGLVAGVVAGLAR